MAAIATLPVLLATGIHSARPAASAVGSGGLYSCTTHSLIYQTNGSSWSTWATISSGLADPMTTRGDMIVRNASNVTARLAIGSTGKVLQSDGTDISWQTPAGGSGALVLLEQHTASASATLDFTSFISSTYDTYVFEMVNILPANNNVDFLLRMGAGSIDTGANYTHTGWFVGISDSLQASGASGDTSIHLANSVLDSGNLNVNGQVRLYNPETTASFKHILSDTAAMAVSTGRNYRWDKTGSWNSTSAADRVRFLFSAGNIASGTIRVYGIAK